jgi:hypothetical protein
VPNTKSYSCTPLACFLTKARILLKISAETMQSPLLMLPYCNPIVTKKNHVRAFDSLLHRCQLRRARGQLGLQLRQLAVLGVEHVLRRVKARLQADRQPAELACESIALLVRHQPSQVLGKV